MQSVQSAVHFVESTVMAQRPATKRLLERKALPRRNHDDVFGPGRDKDHAGVIIVSADAPAIFRKSLRLDVIFHLRGNDVAVKAGGAAPT